MDTFRCDRNADASLWTVLLSPIDSYRCCRMPRTMNTHTNRLTGARFNNNMVTSEASRKLLLKELSFYFLFYINFVSTKEKLTVFLSFSASQNVQNKSCYGTSSHLHGDASLTLRLQRPPRPCLGGGTNWV